MVLLRQLQFAALICLCSLANAAAAAPEPESESEAKGLTAQGVAGEIFDTAIEHCKRGERAQAFSMFAAIREQLDPPPALRQLMRELEATGCTPGTDQLLRSAKLMLGAGYDNNVSQGVTARSLTLGSGDNALELPLDETYRPRPSSFVQFSADYAMPLREPGWTLALNAGGRSHQQASQFDIASLSASLSRLTSLNGRAVRFQGDWSELWLGGRRYQRVLAASAQTVLQLVEDGAWIAQGSASLVDYHLQGSQNSAQFDATIVRDLRVAPGKTLIASFGVQHDMDRGTRPGGDRSGLQATLGGLFEWDGWRLKPQLLLQGWTSRSVFAAGLIDQRRESRTVQLALQAERPLTAKQSLLLEWRARSVRDTVPLYQYRSQSLAAFIQHQF